MTDPKKPHAFHPRPGKLGCGICSAGHHDPIHDGFRFTHDKALEREPINPNEGASPAVDASGEPERMISDERREQLRNEGPQPAAKPARHDYYGLCFELRKIAHFLGMANERPSLIEHCKNAADALDAQAAKIADLRKELEYARSDANAEREDLEFETKRNAILREALMPFALFHSAVARKFDLDKFSVSVVTIEHQSLSVGAFIAARAALKGTGDE